MPRSAPVVVVSLCLTCLAAVLASSASAQARPPLALSGEPDLPPIVEGEAAEATVSSAAGTQPEASAVSGGPQEGFLPRLDVFFPEGELDLRVHRLVNKVLFEGQVRYNFIEGDITAFLRYRYYGLKRTLQITAFDAVEFDSLEELSDEFSRVRGLLALVEWPWDHHHRAFFLTEVDRISSNKEELQFTSNRTNSFVRLGYQLGTPRDGRSNSLVGEPRARVERLFTPFREIGPNGAGLTTALTYGFDFGPGDFDYVRLELEGLKRYRLTERNFLIHRLHGGTFPVVDRCEAGERNTACEGLEDTEILEANRFSTPRFELFRLDGRENLKGLSDPLRGTEQLHTTLELFFPWFLGKDHKALGARWDNWYWIAYTGLGTIGFDSEVFTDFEEWVPDVGFGFEATMRVKKYTFFLAGLVAQALNGQGDVEARLSIKSSR